jgi:hypothetical protein
MSVWLVAVLLNPWELNKSAWLLFALIVASGSLARSLGRRESSEGDRAAKHVAVWS